MAGGKEKWQKSLPSRKNAAIAMGLLGLLNIIFVSALAGEVRTQLDYQEFKGTTVCLLNLKGQVCVFTYITTGMAIFFTLLTIIPVYIFYRRGQALHSVYLSISIFSFFWQLICSIVITIRGNQASDSGYPQQSARDAALAFSWLGTWLAFFSAIVVMLDMVREWAASKDQTKKFKQAKSIQVDSLEVLHNGVGIGV